MIQITTEGKWKTIIDAFYYKKKKKKVLAYRVGKLHRNDKINNTKFDFYVIYKF